MSEIEYPPPDPFNNVRWSCPLATDIPKFFCVKRIKDVSIIKFKANTKHLPLQIKRKLTPFLRAQGVYMSNREIDENTWDVVGYVWGFQEGMQWLEDYKKKKD